MYVRSYRSKTASRQSKPGSKRWAVRFFLIVSRSLRCVDDHTYIKLAILVPKRSFCVWKILQFADIRVSNLYQAATLFSGLLLESRWIKLSVNHCKKYLYEAATCPFPEAGRWPLIPSSSDGDRPQFSPNSINASSWEKVTRSDEMITYEKILWSLNKFSQLIL